MRLQRLDIVREMLNLFAPKLRRPTCSEFSTNLRHLGALGLFFLAILDSSPIPTFGGPDILTAVLSASHRNPWYEYAVTATAGSVIGRVFHVSTRPQGGIRLSGQEIQERQSLEVSEAFKKWGTGTWSPRPPFLSRLRLAMFFAAAGVSDYPHGKFLVIVTICRAVRYSAIAFVADLYGRRFIRVLRHPMQHWGWLVFAVALIVAAIAGEIFISRRLETAPAS